jgi:hypothetical protein
MREVTLALALLAAATAQAVEPVPPAPAPTEQAAPPPQAKVLSEKEQVDEDGYVVRLSLPTEDDRAAWLQGGLRVSLGYSFSRLLARAPTPGDVTAHALHVRASHRVDPRWTLALELAYAFAGMSDASAMTGLRYAATVQALAHPLEGLAVGLGTGFGGLMLTPSNRRAQPPSTAAVADVTLPAGTPLASCDGNAWVGVARGEYQLVVGSLFATGPVLSLDAQYTQCEQPIGRIDKETGVQIAGRQYWTLGGVSLGWWASWR